MGQGDTMIRVITTLAPWIAIGLWVIPPMLINLEPSENWYRIGSITVSDANSGDPIYMTVSRVISKPFVGNWGVTIRKVTNEGTEIACVSSGTTTYRTDAILPKPLTLDWWTYPVKCVLAPGRYRLDTVWQFDVAYGVAKTVTAESNVFQVR